MFLIRFTHEPLLDAEHGEKARVGLLRLGSNEERFVSHFSCWSERQYSEHWRKALIRTLDAKPSALVTDMWLPWQSSFLTWWPMWLSGQNVVFQNQIFFFEKHGISSHDVNIEDLFKFVGSRKTHNYEAVPLSEWLVPSSEIRKFLVE